ncbi:MAG: peptidyl-prolyl cis-trans isomerase [Candidatus Accumulibacter sp.]|uniref:peptidylprolyl isomerase n=1 Tax=Accumulibacter sp. TaxID=2053492 RepID=UPI00287A725F|nr:peptidyl-prolyl cis-trans isomerase [Accumulibacter sp.]MDS4015271.1 peptidyl-prolyl cis-trans isomerase [Accumulibacter sp.]
MVQSLILAAGIAAAGASAQATPAAAGGDSPLFATVNGKPVTLQEYEATFTNVMRQKFYHGKVPDGEMAAVREEVKDKIVQRILLVEEADRRGIKADEKAVAEQIATYDARYAGSPMWQQNRERLLPGLKSQLEEQSRLELLEKAVRGTPSLSDDEVRAYYDKHPQLFTEPEKVRLSVILLGVDPSAGGAAWQQARAEAKRLQEQLVAGGDFAEAARLRSSGRFAEEGGNAGYLHRGMLPEALQKRIDEFRIGEVAEPLDILEGVAIFRLDERVPPKKRDFVDVAQRARDLAGRDRQDAAWRDLLASLTGKADVKLVFNHTGAEPKK